MQIEAYRAMPPERKAAMVAEMSMLIRHLGRVGIRLRNPEYSEAEVSERLVELLYGKELASKRRAVS